MKQRFIFAINILVLIAAPLSSQSFNTESDQLNCFSVLVGKKATVNNAVLFAHNEDDGGEQVVRWYKVPERQHKSGQEINLPNGGVVPQVPQTLAYLWLEMPGMKFSDGFLNEAGVCIASDACGSKEDQPELTDGGIGWNLRRLMAERARSAREAVKTGGALVAKYGYASSGRTYCIAGPDEAWMLSVVNGKHWVAQRIPDGEVAIIPNYYTITSVNLKDTVNFYGSPDLIEYARQRGWYDPDKERVFDFSKAYGRKGSQESRRNISRKWSALNILASKHYQLDEPFPFSFKPAQKVSVSMLMEVLRNHYEGTSRDLTQGYKNGDPHHTKERTICTASTQYGFVTEIRSFMPPEIGAVMWLAPKRPCVQAFTPWYAGINKVPDTYGNEEYMLALKNHLKPNNITNARKLDRAYYSFSDFSEYADSNYARIISSVRSSNLKFEKEILRNQGNFEKSVLSVFKNDPAKAKKMLTEYTESMAEKNLERNQARGH